MAGEYAILSQLSARGFDVAMLLGKTKNIDILVSKSNEYLSMQVKTTERTKAVNKKHHGKNLFEWLVSPKCYVIKDKNIFYCFVLLNKENEEISFRFFIVPAKVVAGYAKRQHKHWCKKTKKSYSENGLSKFRLGNKLEKYSIKTPTTSEYENKWDLLTDNR